MEENLTVSDLYSLKNLLNEPLYLIKEEFKAEAPSNSLSESESKDLISNEPIVLDAPKLFPFTGNNSKNIVFMVFINETEIASIDKVLYSKTLSALKLTDDDVALCISNTSYATQFESIANEFPMQKVICFADSDRYAKELLSVKSEYNCKFLLCPSLSELQLNQDLKIKWWNGLKSFINE
jgi:hypothetical protein